MESITWITATVYSGTSAICAEASSGETIRRFIARAERAGAIVGHIRRPFGYHFDGGRLNAVEMRRLRAGLRRNA